MVYKNKSELKTFNILKDIKQTKLVLMKSNKYMYFVLLTRP
jgi:hypothetical protein